MTPALNAICVAAAKAVGGGVLAIDVLEDPKRGYLVNEVNHTMEFHTTVPTTGVDIPGMIVDYTLKVARKKAAEGYVMPFPLQHPAFTYNPLLDLQPVEINPVEAA